MYNWANRTCLNTETPTMSPDNILVWILSFPVEANCAPSHIIICFPTKKHYQVNQNLPRPNMDAFLWSFVLSIYIKYPFIARYNFLTITSQITLHYLEKNWRKLWIAKILMRVKRVCVSELRLSVKSSAFSTSPIHFYIFFCAKKCMFPLLTWKC